jgi:hypothetical protein
MYPIVIGQVPASIKSRALAVFWVDKMLNILDLTSIQGNKNIAILINPMPISRIPKSGDVFFNEDVEG